MRAFGLLALTFACSAAFEFGCALWVADTERNRTAPAVALSMFVGLVGIISTYLAVDKPRLMVVYVIGHGAGTWAAIAVKRRRR